MMILMLVILNVLFVIIKYLLLMPRIIKNDHDREQAVVCPFCNRKIGFFLSEVVKQEVIFRNTILPEKVKVIRCAACKKFIPLNL